MEALVITARLADLNAHHLVDLLNDKLFDPIFPSSHPLSIPRRVVITWLFLYLGSLLVYFTFASLDFFIHFHLLAHKCLPKNYLQTTQVRREISTSVKSLAVMAAMTTPFEMLTQLGYGKLYYHPAQYGYFYLFLSPLLFLAFSDCVIYFIHRALHHPLLYKTFHKPHHSFINTTPFAAFAFHPVDGFAQGLSYIIFVFLVPFHAVVHLVSLIVVSCWTINIHDRVTWRIPGVNGAAHHTIHHTTFKSNYGQYTILWDKLCGTFKDPYAWKQAGCPTLTEKQVYGKHA